MDRQVERKRYEMLCAGTIAATVANSNPFAKLPKAVNPMDFVPNYKRPRQPREQTLEEQIELLTAVMGCGPGKPN